jgi:hypothetical protein
MTDEDEACHDCMDDVAIVREAFQCLRCGRIHAGLEAPAKREAGRPSEREGKAGR